MAAAKRMRRIKFNTGRIIKRTRAATTKALDQVMNEMTTVIKRKINKPYPPASVPGRPPHRRTGFLHDRTEVIRKGRTFVIRTPQYGIWLEGGTRKMAARPFVLPTIENQKKRWTKRLNNLIRKFSKT